jgi:hypothetical protein
VSEPTTTLRFAKCADCDAVYDRRSLPPACVECGAMEPVFEPWDPAADDRALHIGEVLYTLAAWLEELGQHRDPQGRLYESYADALRLIATALPHGDHLWRDTVEAGDGPASPATEDTRHGDMCSDPRRRLDQDLS